MYRRAYGFACRVRHRIDGLEIAAAVVCFGLTVRHRIDGLEIY